MYCPKCGVHNLEDVKFCRACGADIRLVPRALKGHLPEGVFDLDVVEELEEEGRKYKLKKPPTLEKGLENIFKGIAFLIIFTLGFLFMRGLFLVWVWMLIPALGCVGQGIGQIIRSRAAAPSLAPHDSFDAAPSLPPTAARELPVAETGEIKAPHASVTESTTRNLAAPRRRTAGDA